MVSRKYPKWANIVAWLIVFAVPVGIFIEWMLWPTFHGLIAAASFALLWVAGTIAERYKQRLAAAPQPEQPDSGESSDG